MLRQLDRARVALIASPLAPLAIAAVLVPLRTQVSNTDVALILVVVIVAVSALGNRLAGVIAELSAAVWFDFFFTKPYETFSISKLADIRTAVLLLLVGLAVSQMAARARRLQVVAITDAHCLGQLHEAAVLAQRPGSASLMADHVAWQLVGLLRLRGCRLA
jgi:K+-sensing histidine kinase KdpD